MCTPDAATKRGPSSPSSGRPGRPLRRRTLSWLLAALALTGCATGTGPRPVVLQAPPEPPPEVKLDLRHPCLPSLPLLVTGTPVEMLGRFDAAAKQYHGCADRVRALVDALIVYEAAVWRRYCAAMRQLGDPIPADCVDQE